MCYFVSFVVYSIFKLRDFEMEPARVSGTATIEEQRAYIKIETLRGKNPTEIHSALSDVCGELTVDRSTVSRWSNRFRGGRVSINDDPRPGRPKTSTDERSVKRVADALEQDRRATCEELSEVTGIPPTSVYRILTNDLKKRKISARWVPHNLTGEQKQKRLDIATLLKQRFSTEGQTFLNRIVAIDETWVRDFEPELKSQSNEWKGPSSPRPKKCRRAQSKVKQMMIFAYDNQGIIMTDRVPCGKSVTAVYYRDFLQNLRRKMHKNRPQLLNARPLILHDNARPHIGHVVTEKLREYGWEKLPHPPYSPDMSPPDYDLFTKLKQPMRGHRFRSLEELSAAVTRAIRQMNKDGILDGIVRLPTRWDSVIEKQGDYIEGM